MLRLATSRRWQVSHVAYAEEQDRTRPEQRVAMQTPCSGFTRSMAFASGD